MYLDSLLLVLISLLVSRADDSGESEENAARVVWATAGGEAKLPCDVSIPHINDGIGTILWFKDSIGMPLYSLDFREGSLVHWATTDDLGSRTHFVLDDAKPEDAYLTIKSLSRSDEGLFRCRVDFLNSPTKNFKVNLSLVVPPNEPKIFDAQGREITGMAGPFREEYDLFLSCQVTGGRPKPDVSWWHNSKLLDSIDDTTSPSGTVVSQLFIGTVTRSLYSAKLQCRALVSPLLPPVVKDIQLQVYLKPLFVHIVTPNELLSAGKPHALRCETLGSHPSARLSWLLESETIRTHPITVTNIGNATSSIVTLILSASDDGKDLTCRAANPWFPGGMIEETRTLRVAYPPRVTLTVGSSEDPAALKEGGDIQLICNAEARPAVDTYVWFLENDQLQHNPAEGLVVLGRTMRIRNLTREDSGNYSCKAANSEGHAKSQALTVKVLYAPVCKGGKDPKEVAALGHTSMSLRCEVDSPLEAGQVKFSWTYNKTRNVLPVPASRTTSSGLVSELTYTPVEAEDFNTLACWASNNVGNQKFPCLFNIVQAKVPEPPRECNLLNDSKSLEVMCRAGADGGIPQHFLLEILDGVHSPLPPFPAVNNEENEISTMNDQGSWAAPLPIPVHRETGDRPRFVLRGLRPGRKYGLLVYAVNAKGRSSPAALQDISISEALADHYQTQSEEVNHDSENFNMSSSHSMAMILGALIAAALLILLAIISASVVVVCKRNSNSGSGMFGCNVDRSKRESGSGPSMYAAPDDDNGFGTHFGTPNVMIRPCADIRRDSRRASRALSALMSQEDPLVGPVMAIPEDMSETSSTRNAQRSSQDFGPYLQEQQALYYNPYTVDRRVYDVAFRNAEHPHHPRDVVYSSQRAISPGADSLNRVESFALRDGEGGSRNSTLRVPMFLSPGNMDSGFQRAQSISPTIHSSQQSIEVGDQILRFPENKIARVEISNKGDVGTVVRFELSSKPDLISQPNLQNTDNANAQVS